MLLMYLYYAKVGGEEIISITAKDLVQHVNQSFGYPILTNPKLYNYFCRPERMSRAIAALEPFNIKQTLIQSNTTPSIANPIDSLSLSPQNRPSPSV
eukprot:SAG11_NODE_463_length_9226_cov_21.629232_1_plen_97_part_00